MFDLLLIDLGVAVSGFNMYENLSGNLGYDAPDSSRGGTNSAAGGSSLSGWLRLMCDTVFPARSLPLLDVTFANEAAGRTSNRLSAFRTARDSLVQCEGRCWA